jgi:hypothetical protein
MLVHDMYITGTVFTVCLCISPDLDEYQGNKNETLVLISRSQKLKGKNSNLFKANISERIAFTAQSGNLRGSEEGFAIARGHAFHLERGEGQEA